MIRPISISQTVPNFKGYTIIGTENDSESTEQPMLNDKMSHDSDAAALPSINNKMSHDLKQGFLAGLFFGVAATGTGTFLYKDAQIDRMLKDIASEKVYQNTDSFNIADKTQDNIPEFILIEKNGDETIYDFTTGKIYLNEDGELIERD